MKKNKYKTPQSILGILFLAATLLFFNGCKKATPFAKTNKYDRELAIERNYSYTMNTSIVKETDVANGLLSLNEKIYYKVTLTNNGTDPSPYTGVKFTTNYHGSGISNTQNAASPLTDIINLAFLDPGFTTFPTTNAFGSNNGNAYSFGISNQAIPVASGTKITVTCHVYDFDDNEIFSDSFVVTLQ